ncbi:MAG: hypothetical protein KatS3mg027_2423 [Bacteroidia bacterium]|nr:MAG: hypothetical protein KatS3mg027_2423 [Bacteroidia bacterium]
MKTKIVVFFILINTMFSYSQNQNVSDENYYSLRHEMKNSNKSYFEAFKSNINLFNEITMIIKSVEDTTIQWFFKKNNCVKDYPCYLKPYSDYCSKNKSKEKYCISSHAIMKNLLIKNNLSEEAFAYSYLSGNPTMINKTSLNNLLSNKNIVKTKNSKLPLTPENLKPLYALGYSYNYHNVRKTFKNFGTHGCVSTLHECLIVDILHQDNYNGYYVLTFNYPGAYYSIVYINFEYQVVIIDPHILYNIDKINTEIVRSTNLFKIYVGFNLIENVDKCYVFKINTIWNLYVLYEKMNVKEIYHKYANIKKTN